MSDDDKSVYSMSSDSQATTESVDDVKDQLEDVTDMIGAFIREIETLESQLNALQRPMESLELDQMGDLPFLSSSPFRHATFLVKPPGIPGLDLETRYPYHTICSWLRNYLFQNDAVKADGTIKLNAQLKKLFGTKKATVTYFELLQMLRNVLI